MKDVSESEGHFRVVFISLQQYSQIIEEEQSQLVASCSGRSSHRGNMVSHMHVFLVFFSSEMSAGFSYTAEIPSLLRCATWSVKLIFSGEMTILNTVIYVSLFGFCCSGWRMR